MLNGSLYSLTLRPDFNTRVLAAGNILQRPLEMQPRHLHPGTIFRALDVRVYELDEAIEVFRRDLNFVTSANIQWMTQTPFPGLAKTRGEKA